MKLLPDTHLLLWAAAQSAKVPRVAAQMMQAAENELVFSVVSLWEVAIKSSQGRSDFHPNPRLLRRAFLDNGYTELPVRSEHVVAIADLPPIHKDPFDRLLVAQAIVEGVTLLTADSILGQYPGPIQVV